MAESYSTTQRIGFACLVAGSLMCLAGSIAPYWRKGNFGVSTVTDALGLDVLSNVFKNVNFLKFHGGLFWYCVESPLTKEKDCRAYDFDKADSSESSTLVLLAAQIVLSVMCGCCGLCRMCCCGGGKTVCHGILAFLAGGAGILVVIIFYTSSEDDWGMKITMPEFDWAMYLYGCGAALITVVSFVMCFASPDNPISGLVLSNAGPRVANAYVHMSETHIPANPQFGQQQQHHPMTVVNTGY